MYVRYLRYGTYIHTVGRVKPAIILVGSIIMIIHSTLSLI